MKILFIGDATLSQGYSLSGVKGVPVSSKEEFLASLENALKMDDVGVILLDSDYSSMAPEIVSSLKIKRVLPIIMEVPGRKTSAEVDLKSMISRMMGVKV
ncbi:MAG: V-type ATP synthase subunit F [Candidatus Methanomethyliaceae archaeon]|nr:V-type ATP synthase subunit F [Candidatus Methanomethyliaceae archaeon]